MIMKKSLFLSYFATSSMMFSACADMGSKNNGLVFGGKGAPSKGDAIIDSLGSCTLMTDLKSGAPILSVTACNAKGTDLLNVQGSYFYLTKDGSRSREENMLFLIACYNNKIAKIVLDSAVRHDGLIDLAFFTQQDYLDADDYLPGVRSSETRKECREAKRP